MVLVNHFLQFKHCPVHHNFYNAVAFKIMWRSMFAVELAEIWFEPFIVIYILNGILLSTTAITARTQLTISTSLVYSVPSQSDVDVMALPSRFCLNLKCSETCFA